MTGRKVDAVHVAGPLILSAAALSVALYLTSPYAIMTVLAIGCAAGFCSMATFWQLPSRFLSDRAAAAGIGLITTIGMFAGFVLPYFVGWLKDLTASFAAPFLCVAMTVLASGLIVIALSVRLRFLETRKALLSTQV